MQTYYECNSCNYKSTRKTNANRHIKIMHHGNALAFNFKTGIDSSSASNKHHFQRFGLDTSAEEAQLSGALGSIYKAFQTLEKLLFIFPDDERYQFLSNTIKLSFITSDPAKFIEEKVKEFQSTFYLRRLALYLASDKSISMSIIQAEEYIKNSIASCYHLKNKIGTKQTFTAASNSKDIESLLSKAAITCLFNRREARNIIDQVLVIDPANEIAISIKNFIDTNT